jgi:small subunit ribosomal protein S8
MKNDIISDALNTIMNAKKIEKTEVRINRISKFLINIFEMMKEQKYINFEVKDEDESKPYIIVTILKLNMCKAIKPRYSVTVDRVEKYLRRYLPSRKFGTIIVSTNQGLMSHEEAAKNNLGGSLIAYYY